MEGRLHVQADEISSPGPHVWHRHCEHTGLLLCCRTLCSTSQWNSSCVTAHKYSHLYIETTKAFCCTLVNVTIN